MRKSFMLALILTSLVVVQDSQIAHAAQTAASFPTVDGSPELETLANMVLKTTKIVQIVGSTIAGLRATVLGYDIVNGDTTDETKKGMKKIGYGLALMFTATMGVNFVVRQLMEL